MILGDNMSIGLRIKTERKNLKLTQPQLAEKLGVSLDMVKSMETNRSNPSIDTLNKLADTFGCSVDYLLGREVPVVSEDGNEYIGSISKDDIDIINEIRHYPILYTKLIKDVKRYVSLVAKKMR